MLKLLLVVVAVAVVSEARLNKIDRMKAVFEYAMSGANQTFYNAYLDHMKQHKHAQEQWKSRSRQDRDINTFPCMDGYVKDTNTPTSVHALRPEHISVVAAMGDSLTAGNGILGENILDCLTEYRGRSWSIGGDNHFNAAVPVRTLPNILKKYNSQLKGFSVGKCDTSNLGCSMLNVAVAGETSQELPAQADELVKRLKNPNFGIDVQNEWKMITVFIGGNDLCDYCNSNAYVPDNYIYKISRALDTLKANIPRAFVNLVNIFDITPLAMVSQGFFCKLVTGTVCGCATNTANQAALSHASKEYQTRIEQLVAGDNYTTDDFVVVMQPFFKDTTPVINDLGNADLSYFAPDCFHFSEKGTYAAAKSLWNNMFDGVGQKRAHWYVHDGFHCNNQANGYLRTNRN